MDILILAEKHEQGDKIALGLGFSPIGRSGYKGQIGGRSAQVCWAAGHLMGPVPPDEAKPDVNWYAPASLLPLPMPGKLKLSDRGRKMLPALKDKIKEASEVWVATDPDREGEAIGRNIVLYSRFTGPIKRLWLDGSLEATGIQKAVKNLLNAEDTVQHWRAQQARQGADWLWQFLVRAYTMKGRAGLMGAHLGQGKGKASVVSVGRVQSTVNRIIVERDLAIANFKPIDYFTVSPDAGGLDWTYKVPSDVPPAAGRQFDDKGKVYFVDKDQANAFSERLRGGTMHVTKAERGRKAKRPPLPHSITTLQKIMSKRFGMSSKDTLKIADGIRLEGFLTYPRTEHCELPADLYNASDIKAQMEATACVPSLKAATKEVMAMHPGDKMPSCYTTKGMEHHAIVPTGKKPPLDSWPKQKAAVFEECARALVTALFPAAIYETLTLVGQVPVEGFADETPAIFGKGLERCVNAGWEALGNKTEDATPLPAIEPGQAIAIDGVKTTAGKTKPPKTFTEETLLDAMLNAGRQTDGEDAAVLKEAKGIGTPATRPNIIETLEKREYITIKKKRGSSTIESTPKGRDLLTHTPNDLADVTITAEWERQLKQISAAKGDDQAKNLRNAFLREQITFISTHINEVITAMENTDTSAPSRSNKPTDKMVSFVRKIGKRLKIDTTEAEQSFDAAKAFIDEHREAYGSNQAPTPKMLKLAKTLSEDRSIALPDGVDRSFDTCKKFLDSVLG